MNTMTQLDLDRHPGFAKPALQRFRNRLASRATASVNSGWEDVLVPYGLALAGTRFGDAALLDWARAWADHHLRAGFHEGYPTDMAADGHGIQLSGIPHAGFWLTPYCGEWGGAMVLAHLHRHDPREEYLTAAVRIADHIVDGSPRGPDGVIVHAEWSPIPWVDTLYYSAAPLALVHAATGEARYAREAVAQILLHAQHLRDETTGCFFHEAHFDGRRTPWHWSRGNGWVVMTMADVLRNCPPETEGWPEVLALYRDLVVGLLRTQHACGLWRIIPEVAESHLETSGSIMIATGIATGLAGGLLDTSCAASVRRTIAEVVTWIDPDGALMGCQTPAGIGGWERHKLSRMGERTYGSGALMRLLAEADAAGVRD